MITASNDLTAQESPRRRIAGPHQAFPPGNFWSMTQTRQVGAGVVGLAGLGLAHSGVHQRDRLRELAELKQAPDRSGAGNYLEVDVQARRVASEFADAVNAG